MKKLLILALLFCSIGLFAQEAAISGTVLDAETGETLIGANVLIDGTSIGTSTDFDGKYQFQAEPGTYTILVSYIGYSDKKIEGVEFKPGETTYLDIQLGGDAIELDLEVVVTAKVIERTENAILMLQKKSDKIQDGISSQEISRLGVGNAAGALKKVTGTTVVDGKYVFVRGLGDRYSSTSINGIILPSIDPYRNSAQLDLVPTNLLDNIIASKTFTPDLPGDFTGGSIDIKTKSLPERFTYDISLSTSYNTQANLNNNFLSYDAGNQAWLGFNDGSLDLPSTIEDPKTQELLTRAAALCANSGSCFNFTNTFDPTVNTAFQAEAADIMDGTVSQFNRQFVPVQDNSFLDYSISASLGNQFEFLGKPLGVLATVNYSRSYSGYEDGTRAVYVNEGFSDPNIPLIEFVNLTDNSFEENPQIGGLVGLNYKLSPSNEINFLTIYSHSTEISSRSLAGRFRNINPPSVFESRSLGFTEREFIDYILRGTHRFANLNGFQIEWAASIVDSKQDEPDLRFFASTRTEGPNGLDFTVDQSNYGAPGHFFRTLDDQLFQGKVDFTVPFLQEKSKSNKFKFGGFFSDKEREFTEFILNLDRINSSASDFEGDELEYFGPDNTGIIGIDDDNPNDVRDIGLYIVDNSRDDNNYTGAFQVWATYGMFTYQLSPKLKFIGGARLEGTLIEVESRSNKAARIDTTDILPAAHFVYALGDNTNLRASYSNTLARPNMREVAPFSNFGFIGDPELFGNPELTRTRINNFDLRYEYFMRPGELFAISGFYKLFKDPIVQTFRLAGENPQFTFQNTANATLYGVELEFRKSLDFISPTLANFNFASNFAYIFSESDIDETEVRINREVDPSFPDTRPFAGQSEFVVNVNLSYVNSEAGLDAILAYNYFSDRLSTAGFQGSPDIYERGRSLLDFSLNKKINRVTLKFRARNLLNPKYQNFGTYTGNEYIYSNYLRGQEFSFGVAYGL